MNGTCSEARVSVGPNGTNPQDKPNPQGVSISTTARHRWTFVPERTVPSTDDVTPIVTPAMIRVRAYAAGRPERRSGRDRLLRVVNVAVAAVGLMAAAPLLLLIAAAVRLTSSGPVIYKQPRVGLDRRHGTDEAALNHRRMVDLGGRIFTIYKFRTMYQGTTPSRQVWASEEDPRITPVGRILRSFRLDELPQLVNVLKGDMNIVGPRPEQPAIFADLSEELDRYRRRQRVLPGITGLAQITLPYDQTINDVKHKVELDLQYIRRRSVAQDLLIMAKTMPVMVRRKGSL